MWNLRLRSSLPEFWIRVLDWTYTNGVANGSSKAMGLAKFFSRRISQVTRSRFLAVTSVSQYWFLFSQAGCLRISVFFFVLFFFARLRKSQCPHLFVFFFIENVWRNVKESERLTLEFKTRSRNSKSKCLRLAKKDASLALSQSLALNLPFSIAYIA